MPFHEYASVRFFTFDLFDGAGVDQAVFTRRGGVSPQPWDSLNAGSTVGDPLENVLENRKRSFAAAGRDFGSLFDVWQVHSTVVVCADRPRPPEEPHVKADIILTDRPDVTLYMRFADCVPILLVDPVRRAVGLVHAGWVGTVEQAAAIAVRAMVDRYGSRPPDILAGIGPSIGVDHYPVGAEVVERARAGFGADAPDLFIEKDGQPHFDLWKANRLSLANTGITHIQTAGICTACHTEDWFSHRAEHGRTGRFGALIGLKNGKH